MTTTPATRSLSVAIPLTRGVTAVGAIGALHGGGQLRGVVIYERWDGEGYLHCDPGHPHDRGADYSNKDMRADIADPLTFVYVIRWLLDRPWSQWMADNADRLHGMLGAPLAGLTEGERDELDEMCRSYLAAVS